MREVLRTKHFCFISFFLFFWPKKIDYRATLSMKLFEASVLNNKMWTSGCEMIVPKTHTQGMHTVCNTIWTLLLLSVTGTIQAQSIEVREIVKTGTKNLKSLDSLTCTCICPYRQSLLRNPTHKKEDLYM